MIRQLFAILQRERQVFETKWKLLHAGAQFARKEVAPFKIIQGGKKNRRGVAITI